MGPRDQTRVFKLGSEHLCPLNRLASLCLSFLSVATHAFGDSSRDNNADPTVFKTEYPKKVVTGPTTFSEIKSAKRNHSTVHHYSVPKNLGRL